MNTTTAAPTLAYQDVSLNNAEVTTRSCGLVTFDIFDTLLTRLVGSPAGVFYFVGESAIKENILSCTPECYVKFRQEAERIARIGESAEEVDDKRIFSFLTHLLGVSKAVSLRLRELEIEWEMKLLVPIPGAHALVEESRISGNKIAFVSDMYWSKEFLYNLLKVNNFWVEKDQLWVSSEHSATKVNSDLFRKVLKHNQIATPSKVIHYGNNKAADFDGAIKIGITAHLLSKGNPNRYENILEKFRESSGGLTSLLSGTGRMIRLQHAEASFNDAGIARLVGNIVGPSFTLYVLWMLRIAKAEGIKRLFFVSRDGYVPFKIAEKLVEKFAPGTTMSYLYGSRQAWHIAGLQKFDETVASWLFDYGDGTTAASVLMRVGIEWEEFTTIAPQVKKEIKNPHTAVHAQEMEVLKTIILTDKNVQDRILQEAKYRRTLLLEYLNQEGFSSNEKTGMVDIGWSGRTRTSFEKVLGSENTQKLHWFYFGLKLNAELPDPDRVYYFLFGPSLKFKPIDALTVVAESFCLAPHGSVLGFERENGKVIPCFKDGIENRYDAWGRKLYLEALIEYASALPVSIMNNNDGYDFRSPVYELLTAFSENPDKEDALIFGSFPFEHDQFSSQTYTLAPKSKLSIISIKEAFIYGTLAKAAGGGQKGAWGAGSWALRGNDVLPLYLFAFLGHLRVNGKSEIKRVAAETKIYLKKILKVK